MRSDTGNGGPLAACYGGVRQMGSIFSCLTVGCQSTDRNSLSRYSLTRFGFGSGVGRNEGGGGKRSFAATLVSVVLVLTTTAGWRFRIGRSIPNSSILPNIFFVVAVLW